ncbi:hypothetical protein VCR3J2_150002 [Vibrio coralliirubri]|nr:hypothetical protein VCR6J2_30126 [Vibrio coralliirubri]CDT45793.1 hypothetical protein VCR15J2_330115 [Vibrio coralliirubri]CDT61958.1 hypothetical protein VCR1J2_80026 [Vibrio coralliirubri]CDT63523.1 hypothetical protein VCR26J2_30026 [Vibrio coralliirubri]CDT78570.1 hypothetical protein VCR3J2_150002 [Vibrio coralliirubri]
MDHKFSNNSGTVASNMQLVIGSTIEICLVGHYLITIRR